MNRVKKRYFLSIHKQTTLNPTDLYMNNGLRPKNYNVTQYVSECVLSYFNSGLPYR